jgi:hypothetical protein
MLTGLLWGASNKGSSGGRRWAGRQEGRTDGGECSTHTAASSASEAHRDSEAEQVAGRCRYNAAQGLAMVRQFAAGAGSGAAGAGKDTFAAIFFGANDATAPDFPFHVPLEVIPQASRGPFTLFTLSPFHPFTLDPKP